jgi:hypothetical protein
MRHGDYLVMQLRSGMLTRYGTRDVVLAGRTWSGEDAIAYAGHLSRRLTYSSFWVEKAGAPATIRLRP